MNNNITLTTSQQQAYDKLCNFINSDDNRVFILKGYAGTGKTTLMRFIVEYLKSQKINYFLLAPTGRAAKVLSNITGETSRCCTIHSLIYKFSDLSEDFSDKDNVEPDGQLFIRFEPVSVSEDNNGSVYIIDEASMVSDNEEKDITQAKFGSGRLLDELLKYDSRAKSKFVFVGDPCQLPPVSSDNSPALSCRYFEDSLQITACEASLHEIIRQSSTNSIITASKRIRELWDEAPEVWPESCYKKWGKLPFFDCPDIILYPNTDTMFNHYLELVKKGNFDSATYICSSNQKCFTNASVIRKRLGFPENNIVVGDLLLVIQNNMISGLLNGDMVVVEDIDDYCDFRAGLTFRRMTVREVMSGKSFSQLLLEDTLYLTRLNLDNVQQTALFVDFVRRMKDKGIRQKDREIFQFAMQRDPYLNALRCAFGYSVTCHKAQGGEWEDVFIDVRRDITLNPTKPKYQWIYTAMTRAKSRLHLVNDFYIG